MLAMTIHQLLLYYLQMDNILYQMVGNGIIVFIIVVIVYYYIYNVIHILQVCIMNIEINIMVVI